MVEGALSYDGLVLGYEILRSWNMPSMGETFQKHSLPSRPTLETLLQTPSLDHAWHVERSEMQFWGRKCREGSVR
jgi:hypothetical protein